MTGLMAELQTLAGMGIAGLGTGLMVFFRIGAMVALVPVLGEQVVPLRIRLGAALALTAVVAPAVAGDLPAAQGASALVPMVLTESAIGLVLGLMLRLFILALQMAAVQIAQATSLSQMVGGIAPEPQPAIGQLMTFAGLALAAKAGFGAHVAALIVESYRLMPAGRLPVVGDLSDWGLVRISAAFALAFSLAAPLTLASVLYNLALGLVNRAMPQLQVTLIGAPALALAGLVLLALTLPAMMLAWHAALTGFLAAPTAALP